MPKAKEHEHDFRAPVFAIHNGDVDVEASVIVWRWPNEDENRPSVKIQSGEESVLIPADLWPLVVKCVDKELDWVS